MNIEHDSDVDGLSDITAQITRLQRRQVLRVASLAAGCVLGGLIAALAINGSDVGSWPTALHVAVVAVGVLATSTAVARFRRDGTKTWRLLVLATPLWAIGHLGLLVAGDNAPGTSDAALVGWALLAMAAMIFHTDAFDRRTRFGFLADSLLFCLGIVYLAWEFLVTERWPAATLPGTHIILHIVLLVGPMMCASIALMLMLIETSPSRIGVVGSMSLIFAGDVIRVVHADGSQPWFGVLLWLVGGAMLAVTYATRGGAALHYHRPSMARLILSMVPLGVGIWSALWFYFFHDRLANIGTAMIAASAGGLVMVVQLGTWLQSRFLTDRLQSSVEMLRDTEHELRTLLDDLPSAVIVLSADGRIRDANAGALELSERSHAGLLGTYFVDLLPQDQRPGAYSVWRSLLDDEIVSSPIFRFDQPSGRQLMMEATVRQPLSNRSRIVVDLRDLTAEIAQEATLHRAQERLRLAFHEAPTGMALAGASDGALVDVNESLLKMLGYDRDEMMGRSLRSITHPDDWDRESEMLARMIEGVTQSYRSEKRYVHRDGSSVWAMVSVSMMDAGDGKPLIIAHSEDITERRRAAERLEWAATHDELTTLPNRFRFLDTLGQHLSRQEPGTLAVLFIDLDNFKVINDSLGHAVGDQLLRGMSERLRVVVRDRDLLGRFGGDEFIVMLRDVDGAMAPSEVAERLRAEIAKPMVVEGAELYVTASIGIALAGVGATTSDLLRDADAAMYRAKARGRDCVEVFAPGSHDATVLTLRTNNELRRGLERAEVVPYFQPIVHLGDGRLRGFEVLARWRHPDRGLLGPEQFLPMAEETGLIGDVGASVLRASLSQLGAWQSRLDRFSDLTMSINVSARQLMSASFHAMVAEALAETGVAAESLWLEITETTLMSDTKAAGTALRELRNLGLHLAVDDFGTGYSSLTYLKRFPVESIKVDRSFVGGLGIDSEDTTIVEAVIKLGHSLGLTVVAEGVETPLQLSRLRDLECDFGQGFLFGRPRPADLIEAEYSLV